MALRVTQQNVEVLSEATGGKLRVTQFYVEVLGGPNIGLTSTLGLTDTVTTATVHSPSITDTLTFTDSTFLGLIVISTLGITDSVARSLVYARSLSDSLGISDAALAHAIHPRSIASAISFVDVAVTHTIHSPSVSSILELIDIGIGDSGLEQLAANALTFTDEVTSNYKTFSVIDILGLTDASPPPPIPTSNVLVFAQEATSSLKTASIIDTLHFTDTAADLTRQIVHDTLAFAQLVGTNQHAADAGHALILTDTATGFKIHAAASTITLTDATRRVFIPLRIAASALTLAQTVEIFIERNGVLCTYAPSVGSGPYTFTATPPVITPSTLTLFWPTVAPSMTVLLRNAEFGNKIALSVNRINRKTRGGTKIIYRKSTWPKFHSLSMNISMLNQTQIDNLRTFLAATLGLEVGLLDQDGFQWKGVITNPDADITQLSGTISCPNYATSIQMEAVPL